MTDEGFNKAQSDNLPKMDSLMIAEFFANIPLYTSAEIRGIKAESAGRGSYGDAAVGYVQVRREGNICIVKAKVCPEHKVRTKNYSVILTVDEAAEKVENVTCTDCAASLGGCKHAIAFIMWIHRRSEEPAPTETECYWRKSKLAGVGTSLKYLTLQDLGKMKCQQLPNPSNGSFLHQFIEVGAQSGISSQLVKYFVHDDSLNKIGLHHLLCAFHHKGGNSVEEFLKFAAQIMLESDCKKACEMTVDQSSNKLWHELHYGRITASKIYEAARCKTLGGVLTENIIGSLKIRETAAMKRGKLLEKRVISVVEGMLKTQLHPVGLLLSPDHPYLGATPDALGDDFVVEVKCPTSAKTYESYVKDNTITNKFKAQIHLQMFLFKKFRGIFCVADPSFEVNNIVNIYEIDYGANFIETILDAAKGFWVQNVFPLLWKNFK